MDIPSTGFWHCTIGIENVGWWPSEELNMSFNDLFNNIIKPFRYNREFVFCEKRIKNRDQIYSIKIVHTDNKAETYGTRSLSHPGVTVVAPDITLAFEKGQNFTNYLLYSEDFDPAFRIIEEKEMAKTQAHKLVINQNINQTQSQTLNVNIINNFNTICDIQELFETFKFNICDQVNEQDSKRLSEVQDALDGLSQNSPPEQACGALNKLRRIINSGYDIGSSIGKSVAGVSSALKDLDAIKSAYNSLAVTFGLPTIGS